MRIKKTASGQKVLIRLAITTAVFLGVVGGIAAVVLYVTSSNSCTATYINRADGATTQSDCSQ